jgi:hypothetical protein
LPAAHPPIVIAGAVDVPIRRASGNASTAVASTIDMLQKDASTVVTKRNSG